MPARREETANSETSLPECAWCTILTILGRSGAAQAEGPHWLALYQRAPLKGV